MNFDYIIIDDLELKEIKEEFENNEGIINQYLKDNKILTFDSIIELFLKQLKIIKISKILYLNI